MPIDYANLFCYIRNRQRRGDSSGDKILEIHMNKAISKTTGAAITLFVSSKTTTEKKLTAACDLLLADGHTDLTLYRAPEGKDADRTFYDSLLTFIVKGYSPEVQKLMAMPTKELTEEDKAEKKRWQQRKGPDVRNIREAMEKRMKREEGTGAETPKSDEAKMMETLAAVAKKASGKESAPYDTVAFIKAINVAIKILAK